VRLLFNAAAVVVVAVAAAVAAVIVAELRRETHCWRSVSKPAHVGRIGMGQDCGRNELWLFSLFRTA
jgi:hypothetical protein